MTETVQDTPFNVVAEQGEVILDGPNGVVCSLTADAAVETSERLLDAGLTARGQVVAARRARQPNPSAL